jgi:tricarballylate dehydrogenase
MPDTTPLGSRYDVVVVGGGNAAVCAALEARRAGSSVLILEAAPEHMRGGNSRHTRNVRYMHIGPDNYLVGDYTEDEFFADLVQVTGGETNEELARMTIRASQDLGQWISGNGVRWQGALKGTLSLNRTNAFFLGGGKALLNHYYELVDRLGIKAAYNAEVEDIIPGAEPRVFVEHSGRRHEITARAVVVASGGFEANLEWLGEYWGDDAQNFAIRGTPYNRGRPLRALLNRGATAIGNPREYHAIAVDARGPQFDGGIVTRLDTVPFAVVVNREGRRFSDEGADIWPKRYASWGGLIARQPGQVAFSIIDSQRVEEFMPGCFPPVVADSLPALATKLGLDPEVVSSTVAEYNGAVRDGDYNSTILDNCHTEGLDPPKSHWALRVEKPPFYAYPLRTGITFTYYGLKIDAQARVQADSGGPIGGIFAAGEVMSGNILGRGYLAGFGMTIGSVFGRIAGREAAKHALS